MNTNKVITKEQADNFMRQIGYFLGVAADESGTKGPNAAIGFFAARVSEQAAKLFDGLYEGDMSSYARRLGTEGFMKQMKDSKKLVIDAWKEPDEN